LSVIVVAADRASAAGRTFGFITPTLFSEIVSSLTVAGAENIDGVRSRALKCYRR